MENRINTLQEALAHACIGYEFPEIMAALTLVTGAMVGLHAKSPEHAQAMGRAAGDAVMKGVALATFSGAH
jgi:cystathionine beta-lyase family protein involved in aluminum resistance